MSDHIEGERIEDIRRRRAVTTSTPWSVRESGGVDSTGEGWHQVEIDFSDPVEPHAGLMLGDHEGALVDAEFIANAPSDIDFLLAALDAATARADRAEARAAEVSVEWVDAVNERFNSAKIETLAQLEASHHAPDMQRGGCTCGFCAFSIEHAVIMSVRAALAGVGEDRDA